MEGGRLEEKSQMSNFREKSAGFWSSLTIHEIEITFCFHVSRQTYHSQARNQDLMWGGGGANEAKVDETTAMYF